MELVVPDTLSLRTSFDYIALVSSDANILMHDDTQLLYCITSDVMQQWFFKVFSCMYVLELRKVSRVLEDSLWFEYKRLPFVGAHWHVANLCPCRRACFLLGSKSALRAHNDLSPY